MPPNIVLNIYKNRSAFLVVSAMLLFTKNTTKVDVNKNT